MFVCPETGASLEAWYSNQADVLYPSVDGIPVLVPRPYDFLRRHGPWDPTSGVAGHAQDILGVDAPDAVSPFLAPSGLGASGSFGDWLLDLGQDGPDAWLAAQAQDAAPVGPAVDIGCGTGPMAARMHAAGRHVIALDRSPDAVLLCRALLTGGLTEALVPTHRRGARMMSVPVRPATSGLELAIADARHPPLEPASMAWAHLGFLLDVLGPDDVVAALVATIGLLPRGGVLTLANAYDAPEGAPNLPDEAPPGPEMREVLAELGMTVLAERDKVPHVTRHYDRRFTVRLVDCMVLRRD
ncbi:MAG: class I SAM-dependent methyltransferase [Proteobacteria bacterium]|nr:class I SAM-dependent methyltransferase [Pseudomonadota bacterium]MCP4917930.1 class I SAM-dependent methyltransferase [Pseudomonadota bacterium]